MGRTCSDHRQPGRYLPRPTHVGPIRATDRSLPSRKVVVVPGERKSSTATESEPSMIEQITPSSNEEEPVDRRDRLVADQNFRRVSPNAELVTVLTDSCVSDATFHERGWARGVTGGNAGRSTGPSSCLVVRVGLYCSAPSISVGHARKAPRPWGDGTLRVP